MTWLARIAGVDRLVWLVLAAVAVIGLVTWMVLAEQADDRSNRERGHIEQREVDLRETIERTTEADDARQEVLEHFTVGSPELYEQCLLTARTPENCERFLSRGTTADSRAGTRP